MDSETERRIRERAYEIWVREGKPHGRDAEHWERAKAEILAAAGGVEERAGHVEGRPPEQTPSPPSPGDAPLRSRRAGAEPADGTEPLGGARTKPRRGRKS